MSPLTLSFSFEIVLVHLHMKFGITLSIFAEKDFDRDRVESVDCSRYYCHLNNIKPFSNIPTPGNGMSFHLFNFFRQRCMDFRV